jgi:hypothetical protein
MNKSLITLWKPFDLSNINDAFETVITSVELKQNTIKKARGRKVLFRNSPWGNNEETHLSVWIYEQPLKNDSSAYCNTQHVKQSAEYVPAQ